MKRECGQHTAKDNERAWACEAEYRGDNSFASRFPGPSCPPSMARLRKLAGSDHSVLDLSSSEPHFEVAEPVKASAIMAIASRDGDNGAAKRLGPRLKEMISEMEVERAGICQNNVALTSGVRSALFLGFMTLLNPDDEVLIPDPASPLFEQVCRITGGQPCPVDIYPDFRLTVDRLEEAAAGCENPRVLLFSNPCSVSGTVLTYQEMAEIAQWADDNDVFIVCDETYRNFVYENQWVSIARCTEEALLLNGFGVCSGMSRWRLGYSVGPAEIIEDMTRLQGVIGIGPSRVAQRAGLGAVQMGSRQSSMQLMAYKDRRDRVYRGLRDKFQLRRPEGAFFAFVRVPQGDADGFAEKAVQRGLLVCPGSMFSSKKSHFRLSFAAEDQVVERGIQILRGMA